MSLLKLFCDVDDFWLCFEPQWKASRLAAGKQRERVGQLCPSEVMTILIHFHQAHYRTFKAYYTEHVQMHLSKEFPRLVSYPRFVALIPQMMLPLLPICRPAMEPVQASASSTQLLCKSVIPNGSVDTASLRRMPDGVRRAWAGSLVLNCTWPSMIEAICWPVV